MKLINVEEIKTPTVSCHAGAVAYHNDEPIYAWFGGSREGAPDVQVYIRYAGKIYPMRVGADPSQQQLPMWNPVFMEMAEKLFMFFKVGRFCDCWQTFIVEIKFKADGAIGSIGQSTVLPAGFNGPVKSTPVVKGNVAYCGSSVETHFDWTAYIEELVLPDDKWGIRRSHPITPVTNHPFKGLIQPTLWSEDGKLRALMRSSSDSGAIWYTEQIEDIKWRPALKTSIDNPNSGVDVVAHSNGTNYLIYNPSPTNRYPLNIATFKVENNDLVLGEELEIDTIGTGLSSLWTDGTPEVSYPYAVEAPDGNITVIYTHRRKTIKVATVSL